MLHQVSVAQPQVDTTPMRDRLGVPLAAAVSADPISDSFVSTSVQPVHHGAAPLPLLAEQLQAGALHSDLQNQLVLRLQQSGAPGAARVHSP